MRGIYKITNKTNNKVYIGESLDVRRRWEEHVENLNNNSHHSYKLQNDWNEFGEDNFEFQIVSVLDDCINNYIDQYILLIYEDKYIREYNSLNNGYNIEDTLKEIQKGNKTINNYIEKDLNILKKYSDEVRDGIIKEIGGIIYLDLNLFSMKDVREAINLKDNKLFKQILHNNNIIITQGTTYVLNESIFDKENIIRNDKFSRIRVNEQLYLELINNINKILKSDNINLKITKKEIAKTEDIVINSNKEENDKNKLIKSSDESKIEKNTMKEFIYIVEKYDFRFKCKYNEIFSILRDENIFYYDENNKNTARDEYVKKNYFSNNITNGKNNKPYNKILITTEGKKFLFDKLMELGYLIKINK